MQRILYFVLFVFISFNQGISQVNLEVLGNAKVSSLAGSGSRLVQSSSNGTLTNLNQGTSGHVLTSTGNSYFWASPSTGWTLNGNSGTNEFSNFLGTTDMQDLTFRTNNIKRLTISENGNIYTSNGGLGNPSFHVQITTEDPHQTGIFNTMKESNQPFKTALYNFINTGPGETGIVDVVNNIVFGSGDQRVIANSNAIEVSGVGAKYAISNFVLDSPGVAYGMRNIIGSKSNAIGVESGQLIGVDNQIVNSNTDAKYGTRNSITESNGSTYGVYNFIISGSTNMNNVYGTFNAVSTTSTTNVAIAGYFDAGGSESIAGLFQRGKVIINESGGDYDTRMESENNDHAFFLDADNDMIRVGSEDGLTPDNGTIINGITQTYVADFDLGAGINSGTTIGIGSDEYLMDGGGSEIFINAGFSPTSHMDKNLGLSTSVGAWNNVYANSFVNVSDIREKSNIKNLDYGLAEVLELRPVAYKLNRDPHQESKIGLIAQEVLALIPEAVKTHDYKILDEDNPVMERIELERMGLKYQDLIPVLINATQEQQSMINNQQKQIDQLIQEIEDLKSRL